jgi:tRNA(Ile)-lysidine synthase
MKIELQPGKYVIAVSGGIDSMSLLHVLRGRPRLELVVAHFDHGIRPGSSADRRFVAALAKKYELPFYYAEGKLGPNASEAAARRARYDFLRKIQNESGARAIVTAHHQDDALETAIINLLRGTGRKGLSALRSRPGIERPLLRLTKAEISDYARANRLAWREDSTNEDETYLRNYVRRRIMPRLEGVFRARLLEIIANSADNSAKIDTLLVKYLPEDSSEGGGDVLSRQYFAGLSHAVAREVIAAWLRDRGLRDFDRKTLDRLVVGAKTGRPGSQFDVRRSAKLRVGQESLALVGLER